MNTKGRNVTCKTVAKSVGRFVSGLSLPTSLLNVFFSRKRRSTENIINRNSTLNYVYENAEIIMKK